MIKKIKINRSDSRVGLVRPKLRCPNGIRPRTFVISHETQPSDRLLNLILFIHLLPVGIRLKVPILILVEVGGGGAVNPPPPT